MAKIVTFGEIMLRLSTPGHLRFSQAHSFEATFGGGEANVAVSLAAFGQEVSFVTALPDNDIASAALSELHGLDVDTSFCIKSGERMGIYYIEKGAVCRPSRVIYDREHSSIAEIKPGMIDWEKVFEGVDWFHWTGITPAISQGAADVVLEALECASRKGVKISCDLNYRKNLWRYGKVASQVMPRLVSYCDVIIGNEEDAQKVFGIGDSEGFTDDGQIVGDVFKDMGIEMMSLFHKARLVAFTQRYSVNADHNMWSAVLYNGHGLKYSRRYDITDIVDRVGGGDSFAAGLIHGLLEYKDEQKALEFATAASCLKHTIEGDYNRVSLKEVEALVKGNASGRVIR